jgi:hypothetical protein
MATRRVDASWGGPERDILSIMLFERLPDSGADPAEDDDSLVYYRLLDEREEATGEIVGFEIDDFLDFDRWDLIPDFADVWQLKDGSPLPPRDVLRQLQARLLARTKVPVSS